MNANGTDTPVPGSPARSFLDVRQSATGLAWEHRLDERQERSALTMAQGHGIADLVARVLAGRGVAADEAPRFLDPTIRALLPESGDADRHGGRRAAAGRGGSQAAARRRVRRL